MKKILGKLLCILLLLALVTSLAGCKLKLDFDFDFSDLFPKPEGGGGEMISVGGQVTEWGNGGYSISTTVEREEAVAVSSYAEANSLIDEAIISHLHSITIDYSAVDGYSPADNNIQIEFSNHVTINKRYYDSNPTTVEIIITYKDTAASVFTPATEENSLLTVLPGNFLARIASIPESERRAEDFDDFKINLIGDEKTKEVFNSEELWWALARGYRPIFPLENSKAEAFYLEAKSILREIVTDSMSDYEKLLSIYEYLIYAVEYDYDAYYADEDGWHGENGCYYLEGVFESGRAVCDGKSKALVLFAAIEGIECVRDFGKSLDTGTGHAWNYVKLDGVWYLVDTTSGDRRIGGDVAEYLGDSAEIVDYSAFLLPLDHHKAEYEYSSTWTSITEGEGGTDRSDEHFTSSLYGDSEYDFVINKMGELSSICDSVFAVSEAHPFAVTLRYDYYISVHTLLDSIVRGEDYEYAVFVLDNDTAEYLIIFKPLVPDPEAEEI